MHELSADERQVLRKILDWLDHQPTVDLHPLAVECGFGTQDRTEVPSFARFFMRIHNKLGD